MSRNVTRKELLALPIHTYNAVVKLQMKKDGKPDSDFEELKICEYCRRRIAGFVWCICDKGQERFESTIAEVKAVSEERNRDHKRKDGYYRVKYRGVWYIAYSKTLVFPSPRWNMVGNEDDYQDSDFDEINETPINPNPYA